MTNSQDLLQHFELAVRQRMFSPGPCPLYPDVVFSMDMRDDKLNLNFATIDQATVHALVTYTKENTGDDTDDVVFGVKFIVAPPFRSSGLATRIMEQSLEEMHQTFRGILRKFHVKAVISTRDRAAQKVAERTLSTESMMMVDTRTGEQYLQYVRSFFSTDAVKLH